MCVDLDSGLPLAELRNFARLAVGHGRPFGAKRQGGHAVVQREGIGLCDRWVQPACVGPGFPDARQQCVDVVRVESILPLFRVSPRRRHPFPRECARLTRSTKAVQAAVGEWLPNQAYFALGHTSVVACLRPRPSHHRRQSLARHGWARRPAHPVRWRGGGGRRDHDAGLECSFLYSYKPFKYSG